MTAQIPDRLLLDGETHSLFSNPLEYYFGDTNPRPEILRESMTCTACWRGYIATWEIMDEQLFLTQVTPMGQEQDILDKIFPDSSGKVLADWFSGTLRVPMGEQVQYVHMGYASQFERDMLIQIEAGRVQEKVVREFDPDTPSFSSF